MKKNIPFLVIGVVLVVFALLFWRKQEPPSSIVVPISTAHLTEGTTENLDDGWSKFTNTTAGISFEYPSSEIKLAAVDGIGFGDASSTIVIDNSYSQNSAKSISSMSYVVDSTKVSTLDEWVKQVNNSRLDDSGIPAKTDAKDIIVDGVRVIDTFIRPQGGMTNGYTELSFVLHKQYRTFDIVGFSPATTDRIVKSLHFF